MLRRRLLPPCLLLASCLLAGTTRAAEIPDGPVSIKSIKINGSACPAGSVVPQVNGEKDILALVFNDFLTQIGPGTPPTETRKNCIVSVSLDVPAGWQYTINEIWNRGYMQLDPGIKAEFSTKFFFSGQGKTGALVATKLGPFDGDYVYTDKLGISSVVLPDTWSVCNETRDLVMNTSLRLSNTRPQDFPQSGGIFTLDSMELSQRWGLRWRKCN